MSTASSSAYLHHGPATGQCARMPAIFSATTITTGTGTTGPVRMFVRD